MSRWNIYATICSIVLMSIPSTIFNFRSLEYRTHFAGVGADRHAQGACAQESCWWDLWSKLTPQIHRVHPNLVDFDVCHTKMVQNVFPEERNSSSFLWQLEWFGSGSLPWSPWPLVDASDSDCVYVRVYTITGSHGETVNLTRMRSTTGRSEL